MLTVCLSVPASVFLCVCVCVCLCVCVCVCVPTVLGSVYLPRTIPVDVYKTACLIITYWINTAAHTRTHIRLHVPPTHTLMYTYMKAALGKVGEYTHLYV